MATDAEVSRYQRVYDYSRAYEDQDWERASAAAWDRLEAVAREHERGEYGWKVAAGLVDETVAHVKAAAAAKPPRESAVVTVSYRGEELSFSLNGSEVSRTRQLDGSVHKYFTNASRDHVAEQIERFLVRLAPDDPGEE